MTLRNSEAREISQALLCNGAPMMMVMKIRCFCQSKSIHNCVIASSLEWVGRPENRFLSSIQLDSEKLKTKAIVAYNGTYSITDAMFYGSALKNGKCQQS